MEKSEELQIATSGKNMDIHRMELLPVVCLSVYKEIIKEMAELIEDKQIREIFCSLSLGKDLLCVSQITGISSKNLVSMYKRGKMCIRDSSLNNETSGYSVLPSAGEYTATGGGNPDIRGVDYTGDPLLLPERPSFHEGANEGSGESAFVAKCCLLYTSRCV